MLQAAGARRAMPRPGRLRLCAAASLVMALGPQAIEAHVFQSFGLHAAKPAPAPARGLAALSDYVQLAQSGSGSGSHGSGSGGGSGGLLSLVFFFGRHAMAGQPAGDYLFWNGGGN